MPAQGLADPKYAGMSVEPVYWALPEDPPSDMDDLMEPLEGDAEDIQSNIQSALVQASVQSKLAGDKVGTIPGEIEIFLNSLLNPVLPWATVLRRYLQSFNKTGLNWKRPNRRFMPKLYLPVRQGRSLINLAIAVDTSGSITDYQSSQFVSEISSIFKMTKPKSMKLLQFDTEIKSIDNLKDFHDLSRIKFTGRGGTAIHPVMEWAAENKPQLLLVFTDGGFSFYEEYANQPDTLWLIHNNPEWKSPHGKVIHYHLKEQ